MTTIYPAIRPAIGPAIRSAFDGGFAPSLLSQAMRITRTYGGALYDPSVLSSLYQDAAGTIPVTAPGQPVGLMLDLSGNGHHASQITTTARPLYQIIDGFPCVVGDGVDDFLLSTRATPAGVTGSFAVSASKANALTRGVVMTSALLGPVAPGNLGEFSHEHFMYTLNQPGGTVPGGMGNVDALGAVGAAGVRRVISGLYVWTSTTRESVQKVYVNGVLATNGGATTITASGTAAQTKLTLLASGAGQSNRFSGSLFMASYIPATPTTVEQAVIARFAASRSGVVL